MYLIFQYVYIQSLTLSREWCVRKIDKVIQVRTGSGNTNGEVDGSYGKQPKEVLIKDEISTDEFTVEESLLEGPGNSEIG